VLLIVVVVVVVVVVVIAIMMSTVETVMEAMVICMRIMVEAMVAEVGMFAAVVLVPASQGMVLLISPVVEAMTIDTRRARCGVISIHFVRGNVQHLFVSTEGSAKTILQSAERSLAARNGRCFVGRRLFREHLQATRCGEHDLRRGSIEVCDTAAAAAACLLHRRRLQVHPAKLGEVVLANRIHVGEDTCRAANNQRRLCVLEAGLGHAHHGHLRGLCCGAVRDLFLRRFCGLCCCSEEAEAAACDGRWEARLGQPQRTGEGRHCAQLGLHHDEDAPSVFRLFFLGADQLFGCALTEENNLAL